MTFESTSDLRDLSKFWWLTALVGVATLGVGIFFVADPHETLSTFMVIAGIWFVVAGVVRFVVACSVEENRGATFALAALDLIAGIVILAWPELGPATLAVIIGITLIIRGMLLIAAGFGLRRVGHPLAAG